MLLENVNLITIKKSYQYLLLLYRRMGDWTIRYFFSLFLLRLRSWFSVSGSNLILWSSPMLERAFVNKSLKLLKTIDFIRWQFIHTLVNSFLEVLYNIRWMVRVFIDCLLWGLFYDSYSPVYSFSVKTRKLMALRFVSLTMLRLNPS